jgi:hypothetical protein
MVLAKMASAEDEAAWLGEAERLTVRGMRELAREHGHATGETAGTLEVAACAAVTATPDEGGGTLTVTVDREDAWLFECARMIVRQVAGLTLEETIEALLGEGTTSLLPLLERGAIVPFEGAAEDGSQRDWETERARFREEAEVQCEARFAEGKDSRAAEEDERKLARPAEEDGRKFDFDGDAARIDVELRRVARELVARDVAIGHLAEAFWNADGWRRLGYASDSQYARERLGMSLSSIKAKRALGRRMAAMPRLDEAIANRELGYEAARLVATVATPETVGEWVARAGERTVRYLREEVDAAHMLGRLGAESGVRPPSDETMAELAAIESRVITGAAFREDAGDAGQMSAGMESRVVADAACQKDAGQMSAVLGDLLDDFERARRVARERSRGRVTLKFRVGVGTRRYYRWLERVFERRRPVAGSFLSFLCAALIDAWKHSLGSKEAYAGIYGRDRYRCTSPVCAERGVTPHHLRFRSAGGDDSDENVASLCVWCHLEGIHGGRLKAAPPASAVHWEIGRTGHTVVHGRRRVNTTRQTKALPRSAPSV